MAKPAISIRGLREFKQDLAEIDKKLPRELSKVHAHLADTIAADARGRLSGMSRLQALAAPAVTGTGTPQKSRISVGTGGGKAAAVAAGAVWGSKRYRQFPAWVGNTWELGGDGGPYGVNAAVHDGLDRFQTEYDQALVELARQAGFQ